MKWVNGKYKYIQNQKYWYLNDNYFILDKVQTLVSLSVVFIPGLRNSMDVNYFFDNGPILLIWKTFCGISENPVLLKEGAVCNSKVQPNAVHCTCVSSRLAFGPTTQQLVDKVAYTTTNIFVA